jgi:protein ImuB
VVIAPTATSALLLALVRRGLPPHRAGKRAVGTPGLTVVAPGEEAAALGPLPISALAEFEEIRALGPPALKPSSPQALKPSEGGWAHPRHTHQAAKHGRVRLGRKPVEQRTEIMRLCGVLAKWGIRTLGALAALPRPEVYERLGARGVAWQRLARGEDERPLVPAIDAEPFEAALELEWPIEGLEPLSFVLARLLEPLAVRLERADRGAAVLHTALTLTTRTVYVRSLSLPAPMRDPKTLRTLVLLDLESHPPSAAIDAVRVLVEPAPGRVVQWTLLERAQPAPEQVSTLVARLTALMGEGHVGSPAPVDSWRPGAFAMKAFEVPSSKFKVQSDCPPSTLNFELGTLNCALRRFRLPVPARVQVDEGRPVRVAVDRHGFASGAVVQAAGPWRTSGGWWEQSWDRDEWDIAMVDGTVYRLFVERAVGQWFVEGIFD